MVFSSSVFLFLFLPLVLAFFFFPFRRSLRWRNGVLLAASLVFYAWGEPIFVFVMLMVVFINWRLVIHMKDTDDQRAKKWILSLTIGLDIALIFVFKYLAFFFNNVSLLIGSEKTLQIALPIGISFFTFQIMSYVFDVYYGNVAVQTAYSRLLLYVSMFPQLIAGPIVRYTTVESEIKVRRETPDDFAEGFARFIVGLAKKVLIANYAAFFADTIFSLPIDNISVGTAWFGAIAYSIQIYFDFSGYSDMAIGLGWMFGFHFEENFQYPYIAASVSDFWRRWHISLSGWFRDYVYIPLGGNRKGKKRTVVNLFAVWLLTGIWHGANWTFFVWGLYFFVLLSLEKRFDIDSKTNVLTRIYTLIAVVVGWVLFRSSSLTTAAQYLGAMIGVGKRALSDLTFLYMLDNGKWFLLVGIIASMPIVSLLRKCLCSDWVLIRKTLSVLRVIVLGILFLASVLTVIKSGYNPFIYFNF